MRRGKDRILQSQMCCLRVRLHFIKLIMDSMTCVQLHESNPKASCFTPIQTSDYVNGQKVNKTPHSTLSSTMQLIWSGSCFFAGLGRSWSSCPLVLVIGLTRAKELQNYKTKHWLRDTSGSVWKHVLLSSKVFASCLHCDLNTNLCLNDQQSFTCRTHRNVWCNTVGLYYYIYIYT